ncbi:hypothetical protein LO771_02890 [Streptacidiphilus sp. ASG 303]|uniref:hypothetical protein n=1 Tax=Streptacidiphilus sp. ASG 303 TaxID=2896847 RepID=UPI001E388A40|nr:hypothetical protein [Streptacidiphilus sp. ASG 303]MCD0481380.1 hypothetical protein [Streptacidiphilus sp. ASG 303]
MKHLTGRRPAAHAPLAALAALTAATALLPLLMGVHLVRYRVDRARRAARDGDRGAISIELALAIIALVAVAGGVVVALTRLADNVTAKIPADK